MLGLANVLGKSCCDLEQLYKDGKMEEAKQLQHRLIAPNMAVSGQYHNRANQDIQSKKS